MTRTHVLRNPLLRARGKFDIETPVVSLGTEIQEQELDTQVGAGTITITVTTVTITPTPSHGCGAVYTVSLECTGSKC